MKTRRTKRRVWWTRSQAVSWILRREEAAAENAPDLDAERGSFRRDHPVRGGPPSVALLTVVDDVLDRPHLKPGRTRFAVDAAEAEPALDRAIVAGRIRARGAALWSADVRREFPANAGKGQGRPSKPHFNAEAVERLAQYMRLHQRPAGGLKAIFSRAKKGEAEEDSVAEALQLPAMDATTTGSDLLRAAIAAAESSLRFLEGTAALDERCNPDGSRVTTQRAASAEPLPPVELERQRRNLKTWQPRRPGRPRALVYSAGDLRRSEE